MMIFVNIIEVKPQTKSFIFWKQNLFEGKVNGREI